MGGLQFHQILTIDSDSGTLVLEGGVVVSETNKLIKAIDREASKFLEGSYQKKLFDRINQLRREIMDGDGVPPIPDFVLD